MRSFRVGARFLRPSSQLLQNPRSHIHSAVEGVYVMLPCIVLSPHSPSKCVFHAHSFAETLP
ncbi:Protein of unknown function [Pyronema omphalodes CBS 100304]|uniref:Uncharacterized protein n=1 Tax=Pyronema omphalodes (strain CBS 100304) TaxID=1076935 RepID=U4LAH9_PYROM|nr:Protein of unknown function [Pyronema omphalodes CBS 100304]